MPDFQVLDAVPSKRVTEDAQYHHLLDNVMYDVRRIQKIHKRSQLDEEVNPYERSRRVARKYGIATLHHQKPVNLRSMIETDRKSLGGKKRSHSNFGQASKTNISERQSRPKTKSAEPRPLNEQNKDTFFIVTDENSDSSKNHSIIAPASPDSNIPPPWKNAVFNHFFLCDCFKIIFFFF